MEFHAKRRETSSFHAKRLRYDQENLSLRGAQLQTHRQRVLIELPRGARDLRSGLHLLGKGRPPVAEARRMRDGPMTFALDEEKLVVVPVILAGFEEPRHRLPEALSCRAVGCVLGRRCLS